LRRLRTWSAITLLAHARHVATTPSAIGCFLGYIAEELGAVLTRDVLQAALAGKTAPPDLQPIADALTRLQLAHRDRKALAATVRAESLRYLTEAMALAAKQKATADEDPHAKALDELLAPLLDPTLTEPAAVSAKVQAMVEQWKAELKKLMPRASTFDPREVGRLLANQWVLMVALNTDDLVLHEQRATDLLTECRALLAKRPPSPGKR